MASSDIPLQYRLTASKGLIDHTFEDPKAAAALFDAIDAGELPQVTKLTQDQLVLKVAETSVFAVGGGTVYEKSVSNQDQSFHRAYMALADPARVAASQQASASAAYQRVERDALDRTQAQEAPFAIILGGQPGAGKSALAGEAIRELRARGGAVVVDADRMREEHPRYKQLMIDDPLTAADRTQEEAGRWASRLRNAAIEEKRNLVIDGTLRNAAHARSMVERLRASGYEIELRVMSVNPQTSLTRARLRYEEQSAIRGFGRYVNAEQHNQAFVALPQSLETFEQEKLADSIKIYNARHMLLFENRLEDGVWRSAQTAVDAFNKERNREWTYVELRDHVAALERIATLHLLRVGRSDLVIDGLLANSRENLVRHPQSPAQQRAEAFETLSKRDALAKFPELDGAYAQLRQLRVGSAVEGGDSMRDEEYIRARSKIAEDIRSGIAPVGSVTMEESAQVIELAAMQLGIKSLRAADQLQRDVNGEVVAVSSHHVLVSLSSEVAVVFEKYALDRQVERGDRVHVHYNEGQHEVYLADMAPKEGGKDLGYDRSR